MRQKQAHHSLAVVLLFIISLVSGAYSQGDAYSAFKPRSALETARHQISGMRGLKAKSKNAKTGKKKPKNGDLYCQNNDSENDLTAQIFVTPRSRVDDFFLTSSGRAIPQVRGFVKLVREVIGDEQLGDFTDRDILLSAMAPDIDLSPSSPDNGLRRLDDDCNQAARCAALFADVIAKGFDLMFSVFGLGGLSGLAGSAAGKAIARKILASPKGSQIVSQIANIAKSNSGNVLDAVSQTVALVVNEVGVNTIMRSLTESDDLSFWNYVQIAATFAANIAAIGLSGGTVLALKITQFGVNAVGLYEAMKDLEKCSEECPTQAPTSAPTRKPTPAPTYAPTPPPTPPPIPPPKTPPGKRSGVFGDPHLSTFDRLRFDCQAAGEFITVTSLQTPDFVIQERFTSVGSTFCSQASVSTGVAIRDENVPVVQISTPRDGSVDGPVTIGNCPIDFYVDGIQRNLTDDLLGAGIDMFQSGSRVRVRHTATDVHVDVRVQTSTTFGCHFLVQVFIPNNYRQEETILGLLGTPNGNRADDWRMPNGTIIGTPGTEEDSIFAPSYQYCVDNWCIRNSTDSIFTYGRQAETFESIFDCDKEYASDIEVAVANPSDEIAAVCGSNVFCLVDGVCGNLDDALSALEDEQTVEDEQENGDPSPSALPTSSASPTDEPTSDPSASPSLLPSTQPTNSNAPSYRPSMVPSTQPSSSVSPSSMPTTSTKSTKKGKKSK